MIDDRELMFPNDNIDLIRKLCARKTGIGADGIILLQPDSSVDFRMRHFNPDGSEAEMCGNGARSILKYAKQLGIIDSKTVFASMLDLHEGKIAGSEIGIKMNPPRNVHLKKKVIDDQRIESGGYIEIGVPHYVLFVEDLRNLDVDQLGRQLAHHSEFPYGTNVDFVKIINNCEIDLRTFERGVESETLSCGTGATASVIIADLLQRIESPVKVNVPGGILTIKFDSDHKNVWLSGPVTEIYRGEVKIDR